MPYKPLIGTLTIGAIEGVNTIPSVSQTADIIKVVIQLILGVSALFQMFKKKPKETNKES
jgi:putative Mn2+ efflux pump MntP